VTEAGGPSIRLTTPNVAAARNASVFEPRVPTLVQPAAFVDCTDVAGWARTSTLDLAFPGSPLGFASLDVGVARGTRSMQAVVRGLPSASDKPLVRACGDPTTARGGVFPAGSIAGRIIAERGAHPLALRFDYLDAGYGPVSFNVYDGIHSRWLYNVAGVDRCGSGTWLGAQLPLGRLRLPPLAGTTVELGPFVTGDNFTVRNLRLVSGSSRQVPRC
jgi:hypothetical protein